MLVQVIAALCAPAASGATSIVVDNANGLIPGVAATIYTGTQTLSSTSENVLLSASAIGSGGNCSSDATIGNVGGTQYGVQVPYTIYIVPGAGNASGKLQNSYPWGAIVVPANAPGSCANCVQYYMAASSPAPGFGVARFTGASGGTENSSITGFSAPGFWTTVAQNANVGATSMVVNEQNNACPFTIGDWIYFNPANPTGDGQVIGVSAAPPSAATCILTLSSALASAVGSGTTVQSMPNVATISSGATAGSQSIVVANPIVNYCVVNSGDQIVIDPGPSQEVRSVSVSSPCTPGSAGANYSITLASPTDYTQAQALSVCHPAVVTSSSCAGSGATIVRKAALVGIQSGYQEPAAGGGTGAVGVGQPSDTYYSEGFGRN